MPDYRLKEGFNHYEGGQKMPAGSIVTMSIARYGALSDRFEPVPKDSPGQDAPLDHSDWIKELADLSAKKARATVGVIDSLDVLISLLEVEKRVTVSTAIEDRIEELSQDTS